MHHEAIFPQVSEEIGNRLPRPEKIDRVNAEHAQILVDFLKRSFHETHLP